MHCYQLYKRIRFYDFSYQAMFFPKFEKIPKFQIFYYTSYRAKKLISNFGHENWSKLAQIGLKSYFSTRRTTVLVYFLSFFSIFCLKGQGQKTIFHLKFKKSRFSIHPSYRVNRRFPAERPNIGRIFTK